MQMHIEYLGVDEDIYSVFHCNLYTISIVQTGQGQLLEIICETDSEDPIVVSSKDLALPSG